MDKRIKDIAKQREIIKKTKDGISEAIGGLPIFALDFQVGDIVEITYPDHEPVNKDGFNKLLLLTYIGLQGNLAEDIFFVFQPFKNGTELEDKFIVLSWMDIEDENYFLNVVDDAYGHVKDYEEAERKSLDIVDDIHKKKEEIEKLNEELTSLDNQFQRHTWETYEKFEGNLMEAWPISQEVKENLFVVGNESTEESE
ncbi:hypothetical protein 015DV004_84 [Bacillus phage 015DV004]|nr:hypothetical protein 015DV004_84 [Bacillus phage 015DV004]